jgi:hypothetical protein
MFSFLLVFNLVRNSCPFVLEVVDLRIPARYIRDFALESQNYTWLWPGTQNSTRVFVNVE